MDKADFTSSIRCAAINFAVEDDSCALARAKRQENHILPANPCPKHQFSKRPCITIMFNKNRKLQTISQDLLQRHMILSGKVGRRKDDAALNL